MLISAIADLHLANHKFGGELWHTPGVNRRARMILDALQSAISFSRSKTPQDDMLVICGDLFDHTKPSPQLITETMKVLERAKTTQIVILAGNHDVVSSYSEYDHALGPLAWAFQETPVNIIAQPIPVSRGDVDLLFIPYVNLAYDPDKPFRDWLYDWVSEQVGETERRRIMFLHAGIADDQTPWFLEGATDAIRVEDLFAIMEEFNIEGVFAGNWHNHKMWVTPTGKWIVQCGALVPTGFDNPSNNIPDMALYGRVIHYDTDKPSKVPWHSAVRGPRFVSMDWEDLIIDDSVLISAAQYGYGIYLSVTAEIAHMAAAHAYCEEKLNSAVVLDYQVHPNKDTEKAAARKAGRLIDFSTSLDEAARDFLKKMEMPEGVKRKHVLEKIRGYLK